MSNSNDSVIKILMLGGRRCGKTSVLASMQDCFDREFGASNLTIDIDDPETMIDLTTKMSEIRSYYDSDHSTNFTPDDNPTTEIRQYDISISLKSKSNGKILFQFIDYPGEWVQDKAHVKELQEQILHSHVFLIAIDTPHLMEQTVSDDANAIGRFNELHNRSSMISKLLKSTLNRSTFSNKMLLFVPLKCEKYKNENKMPLVKQRIKAAYSELIRHLTAPNNMIPCTIAITPIFTFGTVEFKRFQRNDQHEIWIDEKYKTPKYPMYGFMDHAKGMPEPQYCEQPLIYVLAFIFAAAKMEKDNKRGGFFGPIKALIDSLFHMPSSKDFAEEIQNLKSKMELGDGYEVITDPLDITTSVVK